MQQKNDMLCVEDIVFMLLEKLKSNGTFDEIRRHCVTDIDAKPTYQNWKQRIESNVNKFLSKVKYTPELNKNTVREQLRKHLLDGHETQDIEEGADRILIQVLAPRTLSIFEPKIAVAVDEYLGIKNKASPIEFNSLKETSQNSIINNVSNVENSAVFNPKIGADNIPCDKTQKDDRKDLRSYKKEKSSSLCKEPKSLNGNRTDDENDTRGSLKQKSTQHKNKTSASDKFKSSSTNHKSNKKDNNCKELVDKFKKVVNKSKDVSKPKNIVNKSMDIINKSKDVNNKSKDTVNKAKDVIDNSKDVSKPKDIVDKSKDIINKSKDVIDNSKDISKPKDIVDKSKDIIIKSKDVNDKSKDMVDRSKDKSFLSMNSSSNSSNHVSNRTDTKRTKRSLKEKKKLSSFCKESKLLKNNQSDDESNAGGSSKQKNTIHKNKSSSSNKSKSSSSNHKNNKKDNTSTNVVDKSNNLSLLKSSTCTDVDKSKNKSLLKNTTCSSHKSNCNDSKRLKLSQPEKNELPFNNKNMEENKSEKLEWNDFKSSDIKNDEQDAANVLLSMSTISYESCHSEIITENSYSISKTLKTPKIKNVDKKKILPSSDNDNIKGNSRLKSNTLKSSQLQNTVKSVPNIVGHLFEKVCSVDIESNEVSLPVIDNVSINMCEKLEQKSKNDMDIKINDSANTVSKQILHEKIENNSVKVLDDDKLHYSFKGFSEEETILCENHKLLKNMIKTLQAKINNHDVINDGFKGFTSAEMYPCKHRDIVNAELIKFKYSKSSSDFIGFSEEDAQLSIGHKYVIQQLELAKKQNVDNHQENVKCDGNGIQNDKTFNEVMTAYLYKSNNDDVTTSKNITKKHCPTVNNNHNHDNWVVEQEMKYKLLPVQVKLERLMDYRCNNAKRVSDSSQVSL